MACIAILGFYLSCGLIAMSDAAATKVTLPMGVREEQPPGTFVGSVKEESDLSRKYDEAVLAKLKFRFLSQPSEGFIIEETTGVILTSGQVDREKICPHQEHCGVKLGVAVQPDPYFEIIPIRVEIIDVNDNWPLFPARVVSHQILESAAPGTSLVVPVADDPDSPMFSVKEYTMQDPSGKFRLDVTDKAGRTDVRLVLMSDLDREKEDVYQVKVIATDGGFRPKHGSLDLNINVLDANDNDPQFTNHTYEVTVTENIPLRTTIVTVHATDPDAGVNGEIVYTFSPETQRDFGHVFGIVNQTGEVYVHNLVDYEEGSVYHLSVIAQDRGPDSLPDDATVIVRVTDVNDHAPSITVNTLTASGTSVAAIAENSDLDSFVAHITVVDKDSGQNGVFNCTLNDRHFRLQHLYETEYKVVTAATLDRERREEYNLALQCRDGGAPPQSSVTPLRVVVTDVNDHAPVFRRAMYKARLIENNYEGAHIVNVNATDRDLGNNAQIRYSLRGAGSEFFRVNPVSGHITAATSLDHEVTDKLNFQVVAKDNGDPSRQAAATVSITVENINDQEPRFSESLYSFHIAENKPLGSVIGRVEAHDGDSPPFDRFRYRLLPGGNSADLFVVGLHTGDLITQHPLDRETQDKYYLIVVAEDEGASPLTGTASIIISIDDVNDNPPVWDFPRAKNHTLFLSNKVPMDQVVGQVHAKDYDLGDGGQVLYGLHHGNEEEFFSLDPLTGNIVVRGDLLDIEYERFILGISALDRGDPQLTSQSDLLIVVNSSLPFYQPGSNPLIALFGDNFLLIIILASASGLAVVILIIILTVLCRHFLAKRDQRAASGRYNCRTEALKRPQETCKVVKTQTEDEPTEKSRLKMELAEEEHASHKGSWHSLETNNIQLLTNAREQANVGSMLVQH